MSKTGARVVFRVLLFKLSAIGDIAIAINSLAQTLQNLAAPIEITWVIDSAYAPLAQHLLQKILPHIKVDFICIDSKALLRGNLWQKCQVLVKLTYALLKIRFGSTHGRIQSTVILHRDTRYQTFARFIVGSPISQLEGKGSEYDLQKTAWKSCLSNLSAKQPLQPSAARDSFIEKQSLAILVGGGKNQTNSFIEKQWPHTLSFLNLVLSLKSNLKKIYLLGGAEDKTEVFQKYVNILQQNLSTHQTKLDTTLEPVEIIDGVGKFSLTQTCDILEKTQFLMTPDSGMGHLAALLMTHPEQKIISLFGPTNPMVWKPQGYQIKESQIKIHWLKPKCSPCYHDDGRFNPCPLMGEEHHQCLRQLSESAVLQQIDF